MAGILLNDALAILEDTTRPATVKYCTYDASRGSGGKIITLEKVVQVGASHNRKNNDTIILKPVDRVEHPYTVHMHLLMEVNRQVITF